MFAADFLAVMMVRQGRSDAAGYDLEAQGYQRLTSSANCPTNMLHRTKVRNCDSLVDNGVAPDVTN